MANNLTYGLIDPLIKAYAIVGMHTLANDIPVERRKDYLKYSISFPGLCKISYVCLTVGT